MFVIFKLEKRLNRLKYLYKSNKFRGDFTTFSVVLGGSKSSGGSGGRGVFVFAGNGGPPPIPPFLEG